MQCSGKAFKPLWWPVPSTSIKLPIELVVTAARHGRIGIAVSLANIARVIAARGSDILPAALEPANAERRKIITVLTSQVSNRATKQMVSCGLGSTPQLGRSFAPHISAHH